MDAGGPEIAANSKCVPKLVSMKIQDGRGRGAPSHSSLDVFDAASVADEERLTAENGNFFFVRSALGPCLYVSQERIDVQHSVRRFLTYMASPTKTAMAAINRLRRIWS